MGRKRALIVPLEDEISSPNLLICSVPRLLSRAPKVEGNCCSSAIKRRKQNGLRNGFRASFWTVGSMMFLHNVLQNIRDTWRRQVSLYRCLFRIKLLKGQSSKSCPDANEIIDIE